jgi:predicted AAA+ superfamily ATPase
MPSVKRILSAPKSSFFLFGPRATGKSTWLHQQIEADLTLDLLKAKDYQKFSTNLGLLREIIEGNPKIKMIIIDEIQKLPGLLDEVHSLIFESKGKLQFILTGSSARKLKRSNVNLLAGRALLRNFHPYSSVELDKNFDLEKCLRFGLLPEVWNIEDDEMIKDYLISYVDTYLKEEIQQEAAVRRLPSYLKFLENFASRNGQVINLQSVSSETGIARTTLNGYLDILEQTMLGMRLAPLHMKAKIKEVSTPKFYFFDTGVVRTLAKNLDDDLDLTLGPLLETYVLHELRTYSDVFQKRWDFYYWGTPSLNEVDFIVTAGKKNIGIEVKSAKTWSKKFNAGLKVLLAEKKISHAYGVYLGNDILKSEGVMVYPLVEFIRIMHSKGLFK